MKPVFWNPLHHEANLAEGGGLAHDERSVPTPSPLPKAASFRLDQLLYGTSFRMGPASVWDQLLFGQAWFLSAVGPLSTWKASGQTLPILCYFWVERAVILSYLKSKVAQNTSQCHPKLAET